MLKARLLKVGRPGRRNALDAAVRARRLAAARGDARLLRALCGYYAADFALARRPLPPACAAG